jgi:hypothetical protein
MNQKTNPFKGRWRIVWMEMWDQDYVDLVEPGYIALDAKGYGQFQFGTVGGSFWHTDDDKTHLCSRWEGGAEMDEASGEIYGTIEEGELRGEISFDNGDESEFRAVREKA